MPSLAEGGGSYPVEEALSLGVPVLCSDIPVMREHLNGRNDVVTWFDPESPEAIVRALGELENNYASIKERTKKAMTFPRPSWADVAGEYVSIFQDALRNSAGTET
jgi:glycosyltransferase involved in cell wall biosynthesis